jgi:hypothetical protein
VLTSPLRGTIVADESISEEGAKEMSTPIAIGHHFRRKLRAKILRILNHQGLAHLSREEVEKIGKDSGLSSDEATYEFLRLKGVVWEGTTIGAKKDSEHAWDVVRLDVSWFQRRGDTPSP